MKIEEVAQLVEDNADIGTWDAFEQCIKAFAQLDPYYYAAFPELRNSVAKRLCDLQEEKNIFKYDCVKRLALLFVEDVYYVHSDFVEDDLDLEFYSFLAEQDLENVDDQQ